MYGRSETRLNDEYFTLVALSPDLSIHFLKNTVIKSKYTDFIIKPYIENWQANITYPLNEPTLHLPNTNSVLRRIYVNSAFKDISTTAKALGKDRIVALIWIIQHSVAQSVIASDEMDLIMQVATAGKDDIIEWLTSNSFASFSTLQYFIQPVLILDCIQTAKELWLRNFVARGLDIDHELYGDEFVSQCIKMIDYIHKNRDLNLNIKLCITRFVLEFLFFFSLSVPLLNVYNSRTYDFLSSNIWRTL